MSIACLGYSSSAKVFERVANDSDFNMLKAQAQVLAGPNPMSAANHSIPNMNFSKGGPALG